MRAFLSNPELVALSEKAQSNANIAEAIGDDAVKALSLYEKKLSAIPQVKESDFGIAHTQLRGVKLAEREERQAKFDAAMAERQAKVDELDAQFENLLTAIITIKSAVLAFKRKLNEISQEFDDTVDELNTDFSVHKPKAISVCPTKIDEEKYIHRYDGYDISVMNLKDVIPLLQNMGFSDEQINYTFEDNDEYGCEHYIDIVGKLFNLRIEKEYYSNISYVNCYILKYGCDYRVIGGDQSVRITENYAKKIHDWAYQNKAVLDFDKNHELVYKLTYDENAFDEYFGVDK